MAAHWKCVPELTSEGVACFRTHSDYVVYSEQQKYAEDHMRDLFKLNFRCLALKDKVHVV